MATEFILITLSSDDEIGNGLEMLADGNCSWVGWFASTFLPCDVFETGFEEDTSLFNIVGALLISVKKICLESLY